MASSKSRSTKPSVPRAKPGVGAAILRFIKDHPKGMLVFGACLLGLIVVFENTMTVKARLIVVTVPLPFVVWALIFCLIGYGTGRWIEWAIQKRRIMKGTYKPHLSGAELAKEAADLHDHAAERADRPAPAPEPEEEGDPATIIDRTGIKTASAAPAPEPEPEPRRRDGYYDDDRPPRRREREDYYDDDRPRRRRARDDYYDDYGKAAPPRDRGRREYYDEPYDDYERPRRRRREAVDDRDYDDDPGDRRRDPRD